ncbi:MAG: hypothetical protein NZ108_03585 [Bacteroidia bacterium]|nr:hypothetical protein [Bacteroidia bacterium]
MNKIALCFLFSFIINFADAQTISVREWRNLTTSGRLPKQIQVKRSNNNLDLVHYNNKFYLAFRTAPSHFASRKTKLYILSSLDREHWQYETEIFLGCDLREPRWVILRDTLYLYHFVGGKKIFKFEPKEVRMTYTTGNQDWAKEVSVGLYGFVPWRIRNFQDTLYLSAYDGRNLYGGKHKGNLRLFYSIDARNWLPLTAVPQIDLPYAEEGEFIFDKNGCIYATVRLESNGSLICKGNNCDPRTWQYRRSKHKYDSALLFEHENDLYLIARRNIPGKTDRLKYRKNDYQGRIRNLVHYWFSSKVTALYKIDKENLGLNHIMDFPSTGDNAFPAIAKLNATQYLLMNYSSDITGKNKVWFIGQIGKTYIYETILEIKQD